MTCRPTSDVQADPSSAFSKQRSRIRKRDRVLVETDDSVQRPGAQTRAGAAEIEWGEDRGRRRTSHSVYRILPQSISAVLLGSVIGEISNAIRRELVKSWKTIDAALVREVDEYFKKQGKKKQGLGDEWSDEDEPEDSDVGSEEEEESSSDSDDDVAEGKTEEETKEEEIDHWKDPTVRKECMERLSYLAREEKGMSVKQDDEEEILELMIPHLRESSSSFTGILIFLGKVTEYIERCCSRLDNLDTVETALQSASFLEYWKVKSNKNLVPTKEEGFATPVN